MSQDFRQQLTHDWRMRRMWEAICLYECAIKEAERTLDRELRPPCRKCGHWPCVCKG